MLFTRAVYRILYGTVGTVSEMTAVSAALTDVCRGETGIRTPRCKLSQRLGLFSLWFRAIKNQAKILGKKQGHSASPWSNWAFLPRPVTPSRICKNLVFRQISVELILGQKDTMGSHPSLQSVRKKGRVLSWAQFAEAAKIQKCHLEITEQHYKNSDLQLYL